MKGAIKGNRERITTLAHQTASMVRAAKLPSLHSLLRPRSSGPANSNVINMFDSLAAKGSGVTVRRFKRS